MDKLGWLSEVQIQKPTAIITDNDVDSVITRIRQQQARWTPLRRAAKIGDRISILYTMSNRGNISESRTTEPLAIVLGSGTFHKNIERRALVGARWGQHLKVTGQLPGNFPDKLLAGKRVTYTIDVVGVSRPVLPPLDKKFAQDLGLKSGGKAAIRKEVRKVMQREADILTKRIVREQILSELLSRYPSSFDDDAVEREVASRTSNLEDGRSDADRARAKLSLMLHDIVRRAGLSIDTERLMIASKALALRQDDPGAAINEFFDNFETRSRIEAELLEDQSLDHLLERAVVNEKPIHYQPFITSAADRSAGELASRPVIELRRDNKCTFCARSKCCTYITQSIPTPRKKTDFSHLLWQVSHENIEVFRDEDGWNLLIQARCSHLQGDGSCEIYESRPDICRDYSVENCEFAGPSDRNLYFPDYATLLQFCKRRFRRWNSDATRKNRDARTVEKNGRTKNPRSTT